jgi:hypothetical protein
MRAQQWELSILVFRAIFWDEDDGIDTLVEADRGILFDN